MSYAEVQLLTLRTQGNGKGNTMETECGLAVQCYAVIIPAENIFFFHFKTPVFSRRPLSILSRNLLKKFRLATGLLSHRYIYKWAVTPKRS